MPMKRKDHLLNSSATLYIIVFIHLEIKNVNYATFNYYEQQVIIKCFYMYTRYDVFFITTLRPESYKITCNSNQAANVCFHENM